MNAQDVCNEVMRNTEGGLDCLLVNMQTGRILAFADHPAAALPHNEIEQTIKLCGDLFHGELIDSFSQSLRTDNEPSTEFVQEAQVTTASTCQFFAAVPSWNGAAIMLIVEGSMSIGLGWLAVRQARERLTQFQPSDVSTALASDSGDACRQRHQTQIAGRARMPTVPEPEESDVPLRADSNSDTQETKDLAGESEPKARFGARSQIYSPRKKAWKRPLFPRWKTDRS